MFAYISIIFIIYLVIKRRELGFLKNRFHITLGVLSVIWWIVLIVDQLRIKHVCTPDDKMCNSGNTFWGDVYFGTALALYSLTLVWLPTIVVGLYLQNKVRSTRK